MGLCKARPKLPISYLSGQKCGILCVMVVIWFEFYKSWGCFGVMERCLLLTNQHTVCLLALAGKKCQTHFWEIVYTSLHLNIFDVLMCFLSARVYACSRVHVFYFSVLKRHWTKLQKCEFSDKFPTLSSVEIFVGQPGCSCAWILQQK